MILPFKQFNKINELIKNPTLTKSYVDKIQKEILQFTNDAKFKYELNNVGSLLKVSNLIKSEIPELIKLLDKYKKLLQKEDIILSENSELFGDKIQWTIFFKGKYTRRVKPNKYIYHFSSDSESIKNDILKNGLIPYQHKNSTSWSKNAALEYPNAVFAVNNEKDNWSTGYIFRINTEGLKNKWWEDLNFEVGKTDLIMTFEPIPPNHIELLDTQKEISRRTLNKSQEFQNLEELIKSGDLEGIKTKLKLLKLDKDSQDKLLLKTSKFGTVEILKFLLSQYKPDKRLFDALLRRAEQYNNLDISKYLKNSY